MGALTIRLANSISLGSTGCEKSLGTIILVLLGGSGSQPRRLLSARRDLDQVSNRFHGEPNILRVF